jgi:hypothetical protein
MTIHSTVIDGLDPATRDAVAISLGTLSNSGVWLAMIQIEQDSLMQGSESENPQALAARILEARKRVNFFVGMQTLGLEITKDRSDA